MASTRDPLAHLKQALGDLARWFRAAEVPGVVIGGVAVSLVASPRYTEDIDASVLLPEQEWPRFLRLAKRHGFVSRVADPLELAREVRLLPLQHARSGIDVDVSLAALRFEEEMLARANFVRIGGQRVPVAAPEDLVVMKAIARRPQDLLDIETILDLHPDLDLRRVGRMVEDFARLLEAPEIRQTFQEVLARRAKGKTRKRKKN